MLTSIQYTYNVLRIIIYCTMQSNFIYFSISNFTLLFPPDNKLLFYPYIFIKNMNKTNLNLNNLPTIF